MIIALMILIGILCKKQVWSLISAILRELIWKQEFVLLAVLDKPLFVILMQIAEQEHILVIFQEEFVLQLKELAQNVKILMIVIEEHFAVRREIVRKENVALIEIVLEIKFV